MRKDTRDLLSVLQRELQFLESGGYERQAWRPPFLFQDSLACPNYRQPEHHVACKDCVIARFIPAEKLSLPAACQTIPITPRGDSIGDLYRSTTLPELEAEFATWLRVKIAALTADREQPPMPVNRWYSV